jgi:hypothetical protein
MSFKNAPVDWMGAALVQAAIHRTHCGELLQTVCSQLNELFSNRNLPSKYSRYLH